MSDEIVCKKGSCKYVELEYDPANDCIDCNVVEEIEHDLLKAQVDIDGKH